MVGDKATLGVNPIEMWTDAENARSQTRVVLDQTSSGFASSGSVGIDVSLDFTVHNFHSTVFNIAVLLFHHPAHVLLSVRLFQCDQFSGAFLGVGPQIQNGALGVSLQTGYAGKSEKTDVANLGLQNYASINKDTSVHTFLEAINPLYSYKVQPYVVCKKI